MEDHPSPNKIIPEVMLAPRYRDVHAMKDIGGLTTWTKRIPERTKKLRQQSGNYQNTIMSVLYL